MSQFDPEATSLIDVAERVRSAGEQDQVSVEDILNAIGRRGFGPLILVFALIAVSPIGAIPGASIVTATLIALVSAQLVARRRAPWIPRRLRAIGVPRDRLGDAIDGLRPALARIDRVIRSRWRALVEPPWSLAIPICCILLSALMIPLALVPWGIVPPATAMVGLGLGLSARDGLLVAIGLALGAVSVVAAAYLLG